MWANGRKKEKKLERISSGALSDGTGRHKQPHMWRKQAATARRRPGRLPVPGAGGGQRGAAWPSHKSRVRAGEAGNARARLQGRCLPPGRRRAGNASARLQAGCIPARRAAVPGACFFFRATFNPFHYFPDIGRAAVAAACTKQERQERGSGGGMVVIFIAVELPGWRHKCGPGVRADEGRPFFGPPPALRSPAVQLC